MEPPWWPAVKDCRPGKAKSIISISIRSLPIRCAHLGYEIPPSHWKRRWCTTVNKATDRSICFCSKRCDFIYATICWSINSPMRASSRLSVDSVARSTATPPLPSSSNVPSRYLPPHRAGSMTSVVLTTLAGKPRIDPGRGSRVEAPESL